MIPILRELISFTIWNYIRNVSENYKACLHLSKSTKPARSMCFRSWTHLIDRANTKYTMNIQRLLLLVYMPLDPRILTSEPYLRQFLLFGRTKGYLSILIDIIPFSHFPDAAAGVSIFYIFQRKLSVVNISWIYRDRDFFLE